MPRIMRFCLLGWLIVILAASAFCLGCAAEDDKSASQEGRKTSNSGGDGDGDADWEDDSIWDPETEEPPGGNGSDTSGDPGEKDENADTGEADIDTDSSTDAGSCDTENEVVLYLSADDSNSMAGPAIARAIIEQGGIVRLPIRTYEFLNYYNFNYQAAEVGSVGVYLDMHKNENGETYNLQIGVRAPDQDNSSRRPISITLSLDTSGSMGGIAIERVKDSCMAIAGSLTGGDIISMVTWSTSQNVLLDSHVVDGPNDPALVSECQKISANGGTDLNAGLEKAYELAGKNFNRNRINRVILMSDGGANVGITDKDLIARNANDANGEAIYLMGVGMGDATGYNDILMDTVTDAGKGAYVFIDSRQEASLMFGDRFLSNIEVAARDVLVELSLPPSFEMEEFHGEEYSENPNEVEPQHLAPNDAMIFHQTVKSCDPTGIGPESTIGVTATFLDPFTREEKSNTATESLGRLLDGEGAHLLKGNAIVAYAEALKELNSLSSPNAQSSIDEVLAKIQTASNVLPDDPDLAEIKSLLEIYRERL